MNTTATQHLASLGIAMTGQLTADQWAEIVDMLYPATDTATAQALLDVAPAKACAERSFLLRLRA